MIIIENILGQEEKAILPNLEFIENKNNFTLDWLRGEKLTFESVNEMRK